MVSDGWDSWPESVPAMSKAAESEIIYSIIAKLEEAFEPNLDMDPCLARSMADINEQRAADTAEKWVAVIGSSHAANMARELQSAGINVVPMTARGWKLSATSVKVVADNLTAMDNAPDLIVVQVLDNNSFFAASDDGSLSLPTKGHDGHYHVQGDLRVASKDQVASVLKTVRPLLEVLPKTKKVLFMPVPRYIFPELKCCDEIGHITNMGEGLAAEVRSGLGAMKKATRSFLFKERIQNVKILDPYNLVTSLDRSGFADPVHLTQVGYEQLAKAVVDVLAGSDEGNSTTDPPSSDTAAPKRIRTVSMGSARGNGSGGTRGRGSLSRPPRGRGSYVTRGGSFWRGRDYGKAGGR
jgi:lysophospholipase L1-like esterase